jgi:hypothetical protein
VVHVVDKVRDIKTDFRCRRADMLQHMRYFHRYLVPPEGSAGQPPSAASIDISVFCDVRVFEWLVDYISKPSRPKPGAAGGQGCVLAVVVRAPDIAAVSVVPVAHRRRLRRFAHRLCGISDDGRAVGGVRSFRPRSLCGGAHGARGHALSRTVGSCEHREDVHPARACRSVGTFVTC